MSKSTWPLLQPPWNSWIPLHYHIASSFSYSDIWSGRFSLWPRGELWPTCFDNSSGCSWIVLILMMRVSGIYIQLWLLRWGYFPLGEPGVSNFCRESVENFLEESPPKFTLSSATSASSSSEFSSGSLGFSYSISSFSITSHSFIRFSNPKRGSSYATEYDIVSVCGFVPEDNRFCKPSTELLMYKPFSWSSSSSRFSSSLCTLPS